MASRADRAVPPMPPRSFDEAFSEHSLTPQERAALVWHLAGIRTRRLVENLLPKEKIDPLMLGILRAVDGEAVPQNQGGENARNQE